MRKHYRSGSASRPESFRRSDKHTVEQLESRVLLNAGDPDPTFGSGGKLLVPDGSPAAIHQVQDSAIQSDGKLVLAGSSGASQYQPSTFFLERLNADGTPDASFGTGGLVTTSFGPGISFGQSVVIQSNGSILVGGTYEPDSTSATARFALARYLPSGAPDASFGAGGLIVTAIPGNEQLASVSLAPGNKVVAVGVGTYQDPAHPTDPAYSAPVYDVARYNSDGSSDTTLGGTGYVYLQLTNTPDVNNTYNNQNFAAGAVQSDGKILIGGHYQNDLALWRLNFDGTLDTSFGLAGRAVAPLQFYSFDDFQTASVSKIALAPNGQIVVAGVGYDEGANRRLWAISRFNGDGSLDTSFADQGVREQNENPTPSVGGLIVQSDGRILLNVNTPNYYSFTSFKVMRLLPNGADDPSFDSPDLTYDPQGYNNFTSGTMSQAPEGSILVAGNLDNRGNALGDQGIAVFKLQNDSVPSATPSLRPQEAVANPSGSLPGSVDGSFGVLGRTEFNDPGPVELPGATTFRVKATAVLPDGRILLAGSTGSVANDGQGQFFLERLNPDGTIDTTFGTRGSATTPVGNDSWATSLLVQADGKIILGGATVDSLPNISAASFALVRYNPDGSLDTTFGSAGKEITDFPGNEQVDSLAFGPGGTIVAAGSFFLYPDVGFDIARYTPNGAPDTSFNSTGMVSLDLGQTGGNSRPTAVAVQSDGKIVIGSHTGNYYAVYRYNASGSIDSSFGSGGMATTDGISISGNPNPVGGAITKLAIQPDGDILAAGQPTSQFSSGSSQGLVRFNASGSIDTTFGTSGLVRISGSSYGGYYQSDVYSLANLIVQPDGEILLIGNNRNPLGDDLITPGPGPMIRKFLPDGTPDPYFSIDQDPSFIPPPPDYGTVVEGAAVTSTGKIIVVADVFSDRNPNALHWIGVARYLNDAHTLTVNKLSDDGTAGTLRWALNQATTVLPSSAIVFQPGLTGTISLNRPAYEGGNADDTLWIFGPGALSLSVNGTIGTTESAYVSGLTLLTGGIATPQAQSYTDSTIHGALPTGSATYSLLRSSLLGDGSTPTGITAGFTPLPSTIDTSTITGYTSAAIIGGPNLDIVSSTIADNAGPGLQSSASSVDDSIIAANNAGNADVAGQVWSYGNNLIGDIGTSIGWTATDVTGTTASRVDARLLPLGYYYGPTPTIPPALGSPAFGTQFWTLRSHSQTDQRGIFGYQAVAGAVRPYQTTVSGGSGDDPIVISADANAIAATVNGFPSGGIPPIDPLGTMIIHGGGGSDTITFDYSKGGNPVPPRLVLDGTFTIAGLQSATPLAGSTIDLGKSTVYFAYAPGQSPASMIQQALRVGFNGGNWEGFGAGPTGAIISTAAAANPTKLALGYADSADGYVSAQPLNTVEVRYTVAGDANLDGVVNYADALRLQANFNATGSPAWDRANFNYDDTVNSVDAILLARNYQLSIATIGAAATTPTALPVAQPTSPTTDPGTDQVTPPNTPVPTSPPDPAPADPKYHAKPKTHKAKHH